MKNIRTVLLLLLCLLFDGKRVVENAPISSEDKAMIAYKNAEELFVI